ncbi:MAG: hypothetical protein KAJ51_06010 [Thermoplasmata archaeon]|nr:hypothetical protein [Thermoplasmata archaeon]
MNNRFLAALAIMLLIFSIFSVSSFPIKNEDDPKLTAPSNSLGSPIAPSTPNAPVTSSSSGPWLETNSHGGSWLDSFKGESGIDLTLASNINITSGNAEIDKIEPPFQVDPNTIALWHLDEGSGTMALDETPNNHDGTLGGDGLGTDLPTWTAGKFGTGLSFDGVDDYVLVPESDDFSISTTGELTVEFIVYTGSDITSRQEIISKGGQTTSAIHEWTIRLKNGKLSANFCDSIDWNIRREEVTVSANTWYYFTVVYTGYTKDDDIEIYRNCVESSTVANQVNYVYSNTVSDLGMGRIHVTKGWYYFAGIVDEIRISNIARKPCNNSAVLVSKPINITTNKHWDTLIINKTQPLNTNLNITILNASTNQPITSTPTYNGGGEFDISNIDPVMYPSIKLKAEFEPNCTARPVLHYWGVSWNATNAWRDSLFGGLKVNTQHQNLMNGDGEVWLATSPTSWYKYSGNPILTVGAIGGWEQPVVTNPSVVFNGTGYMMWYQGISGAPKWQIGLATSPDGVTWTKYSGNPVLTVGPSGSWDEIHVGIPRVLYDGNIYKMWYQGQGTSNDHLTGYATSTDGINWQKHPSNPVITPGGSSDWDGHYAGHPEIHYDGWTYQNWYTGLNQIGSGNAPYQIGYAASFDGINWVKYASNPILPATGWYIGNNHMSVIPEMGGYLGWYCKKFINGSQLDFCINHATSSDGINWINYPNNPALVKGSPGDWDDLHVGAPEVIFSGKQYYMYYRGKDSTCTQIGLAKSKFKTPGILNSTPITIPVNHTWDTLIFNKTVPNNTSLTLTIIDNSTNLAIMNYTNLTNSTINLKGLDSLTYPSIKLSAEFKSLDRKNTPILFDWSVNWTPIAQPNKPPIADAGLNQTVYENQQVMLNGNGSYDPDGSIVNWSWDVDVDGMFDLFGAVVNCTFNDDSINNVTLMVVDDQGANDTDWVVITVLNVNASIENVSVSNAYPRTIGYWKHQCKIEIPKGDHTGILPEFIDGVNANSSVFNTLSTKYDILDYLEPEDHSNMTAKAEQQLLALWLNVVSGKLGLNTPINLTNLTNATTVGAAITEIEQIILNSSSNRSELERAKDIADSINNGIGINSGTALYLWLSDPGSDDINLTIDWDDGSGNTTMIFYNNYPINTTDPYPSQFTGNAPVTIFTIISHNYSSSGTYKVTIKVQDDDRSGSEKTIIIII